jgi:hypothetical protein
MNERLRLPSEHGIIIISSLLFIPMILPDSKLGLAAILFFCCKTLFWRADAADLSTKVNPLECVC